jgi:cell division protein ZapA
MSEIRVIQVLGRELRIRSDEPAEHLEALGRYLDDKVTEIAGRRPDSPDANLLMVAALQLADEIFKLRAERAELTARLRSSSRSLLGRIERGHDEGGSVEARMVAPARAAASSA